jgi:hypothetical protein
MYGVPKTGSGVKLFPTIKWGSPFVGGSLLCCCIDYFWKVSSEQVETILGQNV